jgi:hypothetical protein
MGDLQGGPASSSARRMPVPPAAMPSREHETGLDPGIWSRPDLLVRTASERCRRLKIEVVGGGEDWLRLPHEGLRWTASSPARGPRLRRR